MIDAQSSERSVRERWPIVLYGVVGLASGAWSYGVGDQIGGPVVNRRLYAAAALAGTLDFRIVIAGEEALPAFPGDAPGREPRRWPWGRQTHSAGP